MSSTLFKHLLSGGSWILGGTVISKLIILLTGIFVANILGNLKYGELSMIRSSINMFIVFASVGLGVTGTKLVAHYKGTSSGNIGLKIAILLVFSFFLAAFVSVFVIIYSNSIATYSLSASYLKDAIVFGAILLFFSTINSMQSGLLYGFEDFKAIAINSILVAILEMVFLLSGAYWYGVDGAIVGSGLSFLVFYCLNMRSLRVNYRKYNVIISLKGIKIGDLDIIRKYVIPSAISSFLVVPTLWYIKILLLNEGGFSEVAVYDVAEQWRILILFIPASLSNIALPTLSRFASKGDVISQSRVLNYLMIFNLLITCFAALIVLVFSRRILDVYGGGFDNLVPFCLLSISTIFTSVSNVIGQAIISKSKMWVGLLFNFSWTLNVIVLARFFLTFKYGVNGIALAILISYFIHSGIQYIYFKKIINE